MGGFLDNLSHALGEMRDRQYNRGCNPNMAWNMSNPCMPIWGNNSSYTMSGFANTLQLWNSFDTRAQERNMIANIMSGKGAAAPNGNNGNNTPVSTKNPSDYFGKLTDANGNPTAELQRLIQIEKEIKAKEEAVAKETDPAKKDALSGEIRKLKDEYRRIETQIGSTRESSKLGTAYKFYSNLDATELRQISQKNAEISGMKKDLEGKKATLNGKKAAVLNKIRQIGVTVDTSTITATVLDNLKAALEKAGKDIGIIDQVGLTQEDIDEIVALQNEVTALEKDIKTKIDQLTHNVKTAGADNKTTYFNTNTEKAERERADRASASEEEKLRRAQTGLAGDIVKAIGDKKGEDAVNAAMTAFGDKNPKDYGFTSKDELKAAIESFVAMKNPTGGLTTMTVFKQKYAGNPEKAAEVAFVEKLYDAVGGEGAFKKDVYTYRSSAVTNENEFVDVLAATDARNLDSLKLTLANISDSNVSKTQAQKSLEAVVTYINSASPSLTNAQLKAYKDKITSYADKCKVTPELKKAYDNALKAIDAKIAKATESTGGSASGRISTTWEVLPAANQEQQNYCKKMIDGDSYAKQRYKADGPMTDKAVREEVDGIAGAMEKDNKLKFENDSRVSDYALIWVLSQNNNNVADLLAGTASPTYNCETDEFKHIVCRLNDMAEKSGVPERLCYKDGKIKICVPKDGWTPVTSDNLNKGALTLSDDQIYAAMGGKKASGTTPANSGDAKQLFAMMSRRLLQRIDDRSCYATNPAQYGLK